MPSGPIPTSAAASEEAARSPQRALAAPIRLEGSGPRLSARLRLAAFLAALAAHVAVLYALTREPPDPLAGGRGLLLDAVNVDMVDSSVFESRPDVQAPPAPAAADAVEAREGAAETKPAPQRSEQKEQKAEERKAPDEPAETVVKAPPKAPEPQREQEKERQEASTPAAAVGGAAARGDALNSPKRSAPAAASPGAVRAYTNAVRAALARCKPKGVRGHGTVRVDLVIAPEGGIASLEVLSSRGSTRLRDKALAAVRRCPELPTPPPGSTLKQRWFQWTYSFR